MSEGYPGIFKTQVVYLSHNPEIIPKLKTHTQTGHPHLHFSFCSLKAGYILYQMC